MIALVAIVATLLVPSPARVQVSAEEFSLAMSRTKVRPGTVILELVNYGEDDHDLALRRNATGARTFRTRVVQPGRLGRIEARLAAGRYTLWCTLADHRTQGMSATLVVRAPR